MPMPSAADLRSRATDLVRGVAATAEARQTDRETLLALAEIARRVGGAAPELGSSLAPYELRVSSQNGEDGVIAEMIRRAGIGEGFFVEFGAGDGAENNAALLADVFGWSGLYIEGGDALYEQLERKYRHHPRVKTLQSLVTQDNVEALFQANDVPSEPDLLSIDIDSDDYWVWQAIERFRPKLAVVEYNAALPPDRRLVRPPGAGAWDGTEYFGASLGALRHLAAEKGMCLVHCDLTGNSAYFVREDMPGDWPPADEVIPCAPNFYLRGMRHRPDLEERVFLDLDAE